MSGISRSPYFMARSSKIAALSRIKSEKKPIKIKYEENKAEFVSKGIVETNAMKRETEENTDGWLPQNWKLLLENIKDMRSDRTAVVDTQGCERTADENETPQVKRFQTLISLMLSSQTRDQITFAAMKKLKDHGLTPENIVNSSEETIGKLIYPVGFWKRKSKYIKDASLICHQKYGDDIPNNLKELISLPGVGPKMAYICMNAAWGQVDGIGVDTHVHRISNRLKWVQKPTKTPEQTRKALEAWLPREEWKDINILLVGFGQQTCLPVHPRCDGCLNKWICPASTHNHHPVKKKKKTKLE